LAKRSDSIHLRRALALLPFAAFALAQAQTGQEHWVTTWATAQLLSRSGQPQPLPQVAGAQQAPARPPLTSFNNQAVRMIAHISIGGHRARVRLANAFGNMPVAVGGAHIALRAKGPEIVPASDRSLSFNGKPNCTLPPGAVLVSDPVDLEVPQLSDLAITLYLPEDTGPLTTHAAGLHTTYISKPATGDHGAPQFSEAVSTTTTQSYYWLAGVDVFADADAATIVAFGDSITDGARSTPDANRTWPAVLATRLLANPATSKIAVVNEGIGGNRILRDGNGVSALARFDRDVLSQPGVRWAIILEGINDIGYMTRALRGAATPGIVDQGDIKVGASDLIGGLRQLIDLAHTRNVKVAGGTLTPFEGAAYYSDEGQQIREEVNRWIRTSGAFDAVIDFAAAVQDPSDPKQFREELQSGDHLHPNDAGYAAMANAIDLSIFASNTVGSASKKR
jgi:lysophospholipase L1-like esterase